MENRPEFVATWLGLSKLGVVIPLINHNLKKQSLLHSITIAGCNGLIFGASLKDCKLKKFRPWTSFNSFLLFKAVDEIHTQLPSTLALYQFNDEINLPVFKESKDLQTLMSQAGRDPPPADKITKPSHHDELLYIYTSGTTGMPKAAVITHSRYIYIAAAIHKVADFRDEDVFYSPLPLYHTAAGCMSIGQMLIFGSTVVIRKKFSASAFFSDCAKYNATVSSVWPTTYCHFQSILTFADRTIHRRNVSLLSKRAWSTNRHFSQSSHDLRQRLTTTNLATVHQTIQHSTSLRILWRNWRKCEHSERR